jgi:hypothetical protein
MTPLPPAFASLSSTHIDAQVLGLVHLPPRAEVPHGPGDRGTVLAIAPKKLLNHRFDWIVGTDRQQMPTGLVGQWSKIRVECRCLPAVGIPNNQ